MDRKLFGAVFILNAVINFYQAMTKFVYAPLVIPFREAFNTDNAGAGLLITLVFLGYALARFPSGIMADRIGCARTILWGSAAMSVGFLIISLSDTYAALAVFTFLLGVSSGVYITAGYTLAVIVGSRSRAAFATAYFETFGTAASASSPLVVSFFVLNHNWRSLFILLGIMLAVVTVLFYIAQKREERAGDETLSLALWGSSTSKNSKKGSTLANIGGQIVSSLSVFRDERLRRFLLWSTMVGGLSAASWLGIKAFIPTYLVDDKNFAYSTANQMYALIPISSLFTKLLIGWLADRLGTMKVMLFSLASGILLFIALTQFTAQWILIIILLCVGAFCSNTNTLINSYVLRKMPVKYQGTGFGLFCTAYTVIYSMGPYITGHIEQAAGFSSAIIISLAGAATALVLVALKRKFLPSDIPPGHTHDA